MTKEIIRLPSTNVVDRIGTPDERGYLMEIYAGMLGIPPAEANAPRAIAVVAQAVQRSIEYGWQAGVHMHVTPFWRKARDGEVPEDDKGNVLDYALVDGEKGWLESAARWRAERGVRWLLKSRKMTESEVKDECDLANMPFSQRCAGSYCKIIMVDEIREEVSLYGLEGDERKAMVDNIIAKIEWSAGLYTGKKRVGKYLRDDHLLTGVSAYDVAFRRARKRAIMQSPLTLLPVDSKSESERLRDITHELRQERSIRDAPFMIETRTAERDSAGDLLFAADVEPPTPVEILADLVRAKFGDEYDAAEAWLCRTVTRGEKERFEDLPITTVSILIDRINDNPDGLLELWMEQRG